MTIEFKTDKLGFGRESKGWSILNIAGVEVEVRRVFFPSPNPKRMPDRVHYCAYAELKDSKVLSDSFLSGTLREGDWVGVDTAHGFNLGQSEAEKLDSALHQIQCIIEQWKTVVRP